MAGAKGTAGIRLVEACLMNDPAALSDSAQDTAPSGAPIGGTRAQAVQRLQVGLAGLGAMVLLVGLANFIQGRARVADEQVVPQTAATSEPVIAQPNNDPLADAGLVPDLPQETAPAIEQQPAILPEQGNGSTNP